jgi:osmotically-inducible protein OsmY
MATDGGVATAIARALVWDAAMPVDKLDVTVSEGRVTLRGEVQWQHQKDDDERVVRRLAGVVGVLNLIVVTEQARGERRSI